VQHRPPDLADLLPDLLADLGLKAPPVPFDTWTMGTITQWMAYRAEPGAMLKAPLPSAPDVGAGWRGVELRKFHPLDQLDDLLRHTVSQVDAAIGLAAAGEDYAYVIAGSRHAEPIRAVLGVDVSGRHEGVVRDALQRCGATGRGGARWRTATSRGLAAWSVHTPRTAGADEVASFLDELPASRAVAGLLGVFGLELPGEPIPDPLDLQSVAREQLESAGERRKRGLLRR